MRKESREPNKKVKQKEETAHLKTTKIENRRKNQTGKSCEKKEKDEKQWTGEERKLWDKDKHPETDEEREPKTSKR